LEEREMPKVAVRATVYFDMEITPEENLEVGTHEEFLVKTRLNKMLWDKLTEAGFEGVGSYIEDVRKLPVKENS
jgi:hypothetical protein